MTLEPVVIACDESGAEGENLTTSEHRIFVHAGVHLEKANAKHIMDEVRRLGPSRAPEYKSKQLLNPSAANAAAWLFSENGPLAQKATVYLVDKNYFFIATVIDLLVEEVTRAQGIDLYKDRQAHKWSSILYRKGPQALGASEWSEFVSSFNSLMRINQRKGKKSTVDEFFNTVNRMCLNSDVWSVNYITRFLSQAEQYAAILQDRLVERPEAPPALDPLSAALPQTARFWHERTGRPVQIIHDRQSMLTPERVKTFITVLADPPSESKKYVKPVLLTGINQADSKDDPRVQVADLVAGLARSIATEILNDPQKVQAISLRPFLPRTILWSEAASLAALYKWNYACRMMHSCDKTLARARWRECAVVAGTL